MQSPGNSARGWAILPSGETALNLLGISTQVPAQWQYFSDGPSKTYERQAGTLAFKHRPNKETTLLSPKTALLVQALKALGEKRVDDSVVDTLRAKFDQKELERAAREARYATIRAEFHRVPVAILPVIGYHSRAGGGEMHSPLR